MPLDKILLLEGADVHPTAILEGKVTIGINSVVGPYSVVNGKITPVFIGDESYIHSHCVIGGPAQWIGLKQKLGEYSIRIGNGVVIREFTNVHAPANTDTVLGDDVYVMSHTHIPHDVIFGKATVIGSHFGAGGGIRIGEGCFLGVGSTMHQKAVMGDYCCLGMGCFFKGESPSGMILAGSPAKPIKVNEIGIRRHASDVDLELAKARKSLKDFRRGLVV